jgi:pimeloyl-ACP methyl ester carboxylesterase
MTQTDIERRQACLEQLKRVLPASPAWEAWLAQSGELPPDFEQWPSHGRMPDLLARDDGKPIVKLQDWQARREVLKQRLQQWVVGSIPPAPANLQADILGERREANATQRDVRLRFGPEQRASLRLSLFIPDGTGPFPVFLTQESHRDWALIALRRGYLACVYAGADYFDDTDTLVAAYPEYDWSRLMRRAWAGSRCIDYLATVPQVNMQQIAITGHSRNGKQSLMAMAFDERISLAISSSSGAGGVLSARDFSEQHFGEGIELITRVFPDWFHPRLRFFTGREHKLPVDLPDLVALAAPRPMLFSTALNDSVESTWALQQTYLAVQRVYQLYDAEDHLRILWRPGSHETWTTIIERYLDWCDTHFSRAQHAFPERLIHPWDWERWQAVSHERITVSDFPEHKVDEGLAEQRKQVRAQVTWMLGDAPPMLTNTIHTYGEEPPHIAALMGRADAGEGLEKQQLVFGEYLCGDVYMPAGTRQSGHKLPAIVWLHPISPSNGYVAMYRRGEQVYRTLARAGYAVLCYDQLGYGRRIEEVEEFYRRHPNWSLLGKMARDAQAALDALSLLPFVDAHQLWGLGYGLGSMVGLHLGAVDERLAGFISVCGPPSFRLDTDEHRTGGIRRWSHQHMLLPKLGYFIEHEERVPYDVSDLLACLAPRPVLVVSPQLDREAPQDLVTPAIEAARQEYARHGAADRLTQLAPEDYNRFGPEMQALMLGWLKEHQH